MRIPIPRPLAKVNNQIVARFTGTNSDQQNQFSNGNTNTPGNGSVSPHATSSQSGKSSPTPQTGSQNQPAQQNPGSLSISTIEIFRTATVQSGGATPFTELDQSTFGGPGGDLTNIGNDNADKLFAKFAKHTSSATRSKIPLAGGALAFVVMIIHLAV